MNPGGRRKPERTTQRSVQDFYQNFCFEESTDGLWLARLQSPLPIDLPLELQMEHLCRYAVLLQCNRTFARLHGVEQREELIGLKLPAFLLRSNPSNLQALTKFLENGYRVVNAESSEIDVNGYSRYFLNTLLGNVSGGLLTHIWGKKSTVQGVGTEGNGSRLLQQLNETQRNIVRMTVQGLTLKEIGNIVQVNPKTVATFRLRLIQKLGLRSVAELIVFVVDRSLKGSSIGSDLP